MSGGTTSLSPQPVVTSRNAARATSSPPLHRDIEGQQWLFSHHNLAKKTPATRPFKSCGCTAHTALLLRVLYVRRSPYPTSLIIVHSCSPITSPPALPLSSPPRRFLHIHVRADRHIGSPPSRPYVAPPDRPFASRYIHLRAVHTAERRRAPHENSLRGVHTQKKHH